MSVDFNANIPIYVQVMNDIQRKIVKGTYRPNDKIESVRDLAIQYGVNPNTIQRALQELEREGLLRSERTTGRFICDDPERIQLCRKNLAAQFAEEYLRNVNSIGMTAEEGMDLLKEASRNRRKE